MAEPKTTTITGKLERELATSAYQKVLRGEKPTDREQAALRRFEKEQEEKRRWAYYRSIPQKHWREMSGRQTKVINEQAARYGIPFGGKTIDLPLVVRSFHDFLAANASKLAAADEMLQGEPSAALERYREERAKLARLDRLERERELLPRHDVREMLGRFAAILRGAGEALEQQFGAAAADLYLEALDDAEREIDGYFAEDAPPDAT